MQSTSPIIERLKLAIQEQRRELGLSRRELARLAGVSAATIAKAERGGNVNRRLLVQIGGALTTLELNAPPADQKETLVFSSSSPAIPGQQRLEDLPW
jgi:transcriptional regulator with XRE-family HTH domain